MTEMADNPTLFYAWAIQRNADGIARIEQMRPHSAFAGLCPADATGAERLSQA